MGRHLRLSLLCALLLTLGIPVDAQPPKKVPRVGYLAAVSAAADAPRLEAFRQGLRELGYVEGKTSSSSTGTRAAGSGGFPSSRPSWSRRKPDVLVAVTTNAALAP